MKEIIKQFRQEILALEKAQRNAKEQRKTVRFTGERTMSPDEAYYSVLNNKTELRHMYAAYGLLRGKKFSQIEKQTEEGLHPLKQSWWSLNKINNYLEKYGYSMKYTLKTDKWGGTIKGFNENCDEEIICIGESKA